MSFTAYTWQLDLDIIGIFSHRFFPFLFFYLYLSEHSFLGPTYPQRFAG